MNAPYDRGPAPSLRRARRAAAAIAGVFAMMTLLASHASASAAIRPCALLRPSEISDEFDGASVGRGSDDAGLSCVWIMDDVGPNGTSVTVSLGARVSQPDGETGSRRAMRLERKAARTRRDANGVSVVDLENVGDDAFFVPLTGSLVARRGNRVIEVSLENWVGVEDAQARATALAQRALTRL